MNITEKKKMEAIKEICIKNNKDHAVMITYMHDGDVDMDAVETITFKNHGMVLKFRNDLLQEGDLYYYDELEIINDGKIKLWGTSYLEWV